MNKQDDIGDLNPNGPLPFRQPLLVFGLTPDPSVHEWYVEVDGQIELYLKGGYREEGSEIDRKADATPLLKALARKLKQQGVSIHHVVVYKGSGGPSHVLRGGIFFSRMKRGVSFEETTPTWMDK